MTELQQELYAKYYYKDGVLFHRINGHKFKKNEPAGGISNGYVITRFRGKKCPTHRLIYAYHYGWMPEFIDHINGNRSDNRIENLRPATRAQNVYNIGKRPTKNPNAASIYKGVFKNKHGSYIAAACSNGLKQYLGSFKTEASAALAYNEKAKELHGEFARLNVIED